MYQISESQHYKLFCFFVFRLTHASQLALAHRQPDGLVRSTPCRPHGDGSVLQGLRSCVVARGFRGGVGGCPAGVSPRPQPGSRWPEKRCVSRAVNIHPAGLHFGKPCTTGRVLPPGALRPLSQGACGSSLSHGTIATVSGCAIHSAFGRVVASQRTRTYQPRLVAFP